MADDLGTRADDARINKVIGFALLVSIPLTVGFGAALIGATSGEISVALGGVTGGLIGGALAAYAAYVGVRTTIEGQAKNDDRQLATELKRIRLALHTEVGMIGLQCLREFVDWWHAIESPYRKEPRTAILPPLTIYKSVADRIGLLTRDEIVPLIAFAGTVHDATVVAADMAPRQQDDDDKVTIAMLMSNACGYAADFLDAVQDIDDREKDAKFAVELRKAFAAMASRRDTAPPAVTTT